jgi:transitional endoplasmic reticulum ATPase
MKTRSNYLSRLQQTTGFWLFGVIPAVIAVLSALMMFGVWMNKRLPPLSFQVFDKFTPEAGVLLGLVAYQLILHVARIWMLKRSADENGTLAYEPKVISDSLRAFVLAVVTPYIVFFALWSLYGTKTAATNYVLVGAFGAVTFLSWVIIRTGWLYGFAIAERSQMQYGGSPEQAQHESVARKEKSKITFADILGNAAIKRRLLEAAKAITAPKSESGAARNGILLHGEPGNGKTVFADALAGELKLPILKLTHSDVASRWVGERTEKIKAAFDQAIRSQPCVLFIDEIDSFIPDRSGASTQTKEDTDVVNSLLTLLVDVRKHKVVVMAATNYMDRLDGAAVREGRFDFKVEITPPDEEARVGLLSSGLKKNMKKVIADQSTIQNVAQRWNGFSVKRILAVTEELPSYWAELKESGTVKTKLEYDDFMAALRRIQGRKGSSPENVKPMSDLMFPEVTKEALNMLSSRLRDPQRVERLGGTLPSGVLFYGPPGTGKTAACKALAKEVQWAFLIATGTDLARDPKGLDKLYAQAKELRPCIVFIDEADDLVRSREYSSNTEATNKLLTIMDGVNDRVRDVVWIAATNHPDQVDQALLRGGRFTEKVEFVRPDEDQLSEHIGKWLKTRKIALESGLTADHVAGLVGDESIANLEAVLQYAVNRSISKSTDD